MPSFIAPTGDRVLDGLRRIAQGMPTHEASKLAKELIEFLAPVDCPHEPLELEGDWIVAEDMAPPWRYVSSKQGANIYTYPDGRYATPVKRKIADVLRGQGAYGHLVHGVGGLYIEASSVEALLVKLECVEKAFGSSQDRHRSLTSQVSSDTGRPKRLERTKNARTSQEPPHTRRLHRQNG